MSVYRVRLYFGNDCIGVSCVRASDEDAAKARAWQLLRSNGLMPAGLGVLSATAEPTANRRIER